MLEPGTQLGGYQIERVLGQGGMGTVYEALQLSLDRTVALKVLSGAVSDDPVFRERFRREGILQAGLEHPHIVTVYEAGEIDSYLFLAMRLIRGETLKDMVRLGELTAQRTLRLVAPLADALDTAHRAGLIHRDVKPQNVLVGPGDHAYLADFGLTKAAAGSTLTSSGQFMGTPDYIAPELVKGEGASRASDVYAFAAVVYECLTGEVPYPRESATATLVAHVHDPPPRVRARQPELPAEVDHVIARGMSKEPHERQATVKGLVVDVERALASRTPSVTATVSPAVDAVRAPRAARSVATAWPRRPRARVAVIGALATLASVAIVVAFVAGRGGGGESGLPGGGAASSTVTLGSALRQAADLTNCTGGSPEPCTIAQTALRGRKLRSPFERGVITRWRVRGGSGSVAISILRDSKRGRVIRSSDFEEVSGAETREFATRLPIAREQTIALEVGDDTRYGAAPSSGADLVRWNPPLQTAGAQRTVGPGELEILLNADVEPDGDGDGYGDVTQDDCPGDRERNTNC